MTKHKAKKSQANPYPDKVQCEHCAFSLNAYSNFWFPKSLAAGRWKRAMRVMKDHMATYHPDKLEAWKAFHRIA